MAALRNVLQLLCCVILLFTLQVQAAERWDVSQTVLKIQSVLQGSSFQPRVGSAIFIEFKGTPLVLTSDHVIFHSNKSLKHSVLDSQGQQLELEFVAADAGKGLAVLRPLADAGSFKKYPLFARAPPELHESQGLTLIGYPAEATESLISEGGRVHNLQAASRIFVELPALVEVVDGHSEFGMSGGAAFSADGTFRGILSHQKDASGASTLIIPETVIRPWLEDLLDDEGHLQSPSPILLFQDPAQQVSDFLSYRTGFLYITTASPFGPQAARSLVVSSTRRAATELLFAPRALEPAQSFLLADRQVHLRTLGFRKKGSFVFAGAISGHLVSDLRLLNNENLEALWTVEGYDRSAALAAAADVGKRLQAVLPELQFKSSRHLLAFAKKVIELVQMPPRGGFESDHDHRYHGAWRFLKPKDIRYVLQEPQLQGEWQAVLSQAQGESFKGLLEELEQTFADLTL